MNTPHILIAEDDQFLRDLLDAHVHAAGLPVAVVTSGADVLPYIATHPVSLLLLDLSLPGMDGMSILKALRSESVTVNLPIFVFTNNDDPALTEAVAQLNARYYFKALTDMHDLVADIQETLKS